MDERQITLLYNAIVLLEEHYTKEELLDEMGMTEEEYDEIMDDYRDTICVTFG